MCYEEDYDWEEEELFRSYSRRKQLRNDSGKHMSLGKEGKLLRKIMSQTGKTEEEVRAIKKYRIMLSDAQKEQKQGKAKRSPAQKAVDRLVKKICRELKLAKEHPKVLTELKNRTQKIKEGVPWTDKPEMEFSAHNLSYLKSGINLSGKDRNIVEIENDIKEAEQIVLELTKPIR